MAEISHPEHGRIEVEIIDTESHHGVYHQVKAVADALALTDESGNNPWIPSDEIHGVDE